MMNIKHYFKIILVLIILCMYSAGALAEDAEFYNYKGIGYMEKGDYDAAIASFTKGINIDPKNHTLYNNRGASYIHKGNYDLAIADYNKALSLNQPFAHGYLFNIGSAYYKAGRYSEALSTLNQGIAFGKRLCIFYTMRGNVYYKINRREDAINDYQTAIKNFDTAEDVKYYNPYYNLGYLYMDTAEWQTAINCFNDAIRVQPSASDAYYNRGICYRNIGKVEQAQADFAEAKNLGYKG